MDQTTAAGGNEDRRHSRHGRHKVVVIGSGFGGLFTTKSLRGVDVDITLIAKTTHHLFQPLLYQVATGILSAGEIAPSTREILRRQGNSRVLLGEVTDIDLAGRTVRSTVLGQTTVTAYDTLVVAAGANTGVAVGDVAYASSSIPVGVVTAVSGGSARITLLSASGEAAQAWVGNARTPVTLRGVGSGAFVASAPRAASTTIGDLVYVAGPGSVPVGVVRTEGGEPSAPFITLGISGIVNIFSLPYVVIRHDGSAAWPLGSPLATSTPAL